MKEHPPRTSCGSARRQPPRQGLSGFSGSGFRVEGLGFEGLGFEALGFQALGFRLQGSGFRATLPYT